MLHELETAKVLESQNEPIDVESDIVTCTEGKYTMRLDTIIALIIIMSISITF